MLTKLLVIAALIVGGLAFVGDAAPAAAAVAPASSASARDFTWSGLILALLPLFYTLGGWQLAGYLAPELKDPVRTLPRAVLLGVLGVVVVYLAVNASYLAVLGIDGLAADKGFAQTLSIRAFGAFGAKVLAAGMTISAFGICAVNIIATPWLYVAIAKEGLFFRTVGEVSPRTGVPARALCIQGVLTCVYLLSSLQDLVDSCVFVEWIFHFLAALALIRLRKLAPDLPRPVKTPLYPLLPLLYLATAAVIVVGTLYTAPPFVKYSGASVVALGAVVYWPWRAYFGRLA
jgi:APA family basic amino acid/polyamine antiporter